MPPDSFLDNFDHCDYFQEFRPLFAIQIREIIEKVREEAILFYYKEKNKLYVKEKVNILKNE